MRRDHLVTIQAPTSDVTADGQPLINWPTLGTEWANIKHQSGVEVIKAGAATSIVKASINMRARDDINSGMRIVYRGVIYQVEAVLPDFERPDSMFLACEVKV